MTDVAIKGDPIRRGGHALIYISGGAAKGLVDPRFRLSREGYEAGTLGADGWQIAGALLTPLAAHADGANLVLSIGPAVVDLVESGVVIFAVPSIAFDEAVFWPEMPLSRGGQGGATMLLPEQVAPGPSPIEARRKVDPPAPPPPPLVAAAPPAIAPPASGPPVVVPPASAPAVIAPPVPRVVPPVPLPTVRSDAAARRTRSPLPLLVAVLLLAAAGAGGVWWLTPHPAASPDPQANSLGAVAGASRNCTTGSIQELVACAPNVDALYRLAEQRWDGGQANDGLALMQIAANRGSAGAALRLAQLYDPATFRPGGPIPYASTRKAAQYYRGAAEAHQRGADGPREALRRRLQGDSDNGDTLAAVTLKDFWP